MTIPLMMINCPHCKRTIQFEAYLKVTDLEFMQQYPSDVFYFTYRVENILKVAGINTVQQLLAMCERDLLQLDGFGRKCLEDVKEQLAKRGLHLGMMEGMEP